MIDGVTMFRLSQEPRVDFFYTTKEWAGRPTIREPHKCTELVWADPDELPEDALDFLAQAWADTQNGVPRRVFGFASVAM